MSFRLLLKAALLFVGVISALECEADCWPELLEERAGVSLALDRRNFDPDELSNERAELQELLANCHETAAFFYSPPDNFPTKHSYSLIEIAISADEPELTMQLIERLRQSQLLEPADIVVSGQYVNTAAHYEAAEVMKALLNADVYLTAGPSQSADIALFVSRVFTEAGLDIVRMLVESGASIEAVVDGSPTPINLAARNGDLWKVQCLYLMGATLPPPSVVEERLAQDFLLDSKDALEKVRTFLANHDREIAEPVVKACASNSR